jgi:ribose transport system substrate-binding protein
MKTRRSGTTWRAPLALAMLIGTLVMSGCAGGTVSNVSGSTKGSDRAASASAQSLDFIPASSRKLYDGFNSVPVTANPLAEYHAPSGRLKYCLAESYTKEAFRVGPPLGSVGMFKKLVDQLQKLGKASGPLVITDANNNASVQLSQMNNLVQQGCQVIITYPVSATGLCSAVDNAWSKGILVVSYGTEASCGHMISVDTNEYHYGYLAAQNLADRLGHQGNVMLMNAIKGVPAAEAERQGALDAFKQYPKMHVIGEAYGNWTSSIAKSQMLQFASTHPGKIDGVWQAGLMSAAVWQALQQSGRGQGVKVEAFSGTCSGLALWKQNGGDNFSFLQAGEPYAYMTMQAIQRVLAGAQPVTNVLLYEEPVITQQSLDAWFKPGMTLNSDCYPNAPEQYRVKGNQLDPLFSSVPSNLPELTYFTG